MDPAEIKADDWQIAGIAQVGGAALKVGAGVFWFQLKSDVARLSDTFMLTAAGIGAGGSLAVLLTFLPDELLNGFEWPASLVSVSEMRPFETSAKRLAERAMG
jgi:hypothetical protein